MEIFDFRDSELDLDYNFCFLLGVGVGFEFAFVGFKIFDFGHCCTVQTCVRAVAKT